MKFYNPFKPHVVEDVKETYVVRKLTLLGWKYLRPDYNWGIFTYWYYSKQEANQYLLTRNCINWKII